MEPKEVGARERTMTEKGKEYFVSECEKKLEGLRRQIGNQERSVMQCVGNGGEKIELTVLMDELSRLWKEFEELCGKLIVCVDEEHKNDIERMKSVIGLSVEETLGHGERKCVSVKSMKTSRKSSRKSESTRKSKTGSRRSSSSSSLGILKMKLVEAELELEESKLECEMRRTEENYSRKRFELEQEEKSSQRLWMAQRAARKFEILQKHLEEQELGSDEPDEELSDHAVEEIGKNVDAEEFKPRIVVDVGMEPKSACEEAEKPVEKVPSEVQRTVSDPVGEMKSDSVVGPVGKMCESEQCTQMVSDPVREHNTQSLLELMLEQSAPEVQVEVFSGDPLDFRLFLTNFENEVESKIKGNSGRLNRLIALTKGTEAHDIVEPFIYCPSGYEKAKVKLEREYGNEHKISVAYHKRISEWPAVNGGPAFRKFYLFLNKVQWSVDSEDYQVELNSTENLKRLAAKLPVYAQHIWCRKATEIYEGDRPRKPTFQDFLKLVERESLVANNPSFATQGSSTGRGMSEKVRGHPGQYQDRPGLGRAWRPVRVSATNTGGPGPGLVCEYCKMRNHQLDKCFGFRKLSLDDRTKYVRQNGLCFGCLKRENHVVRDCKNRLICTICHGHHPTALHREYRARDMNNNESVDKDKDDSVPNPNSGMKEGTEKKGFATHTGGEKSVAMSCVVAEVVSGVTGKGVKTYCFLDSLANSSFITQDLYEQVAVGSGLKMSSEEIDLSTMSGTETKMMKSVTGISVRKLDGEVEVKLPKLYTVERLPFDEGDIMDKSVVDKWPHLKHLIDEIPGYDSNIPIGLLVGNDVPGLLAPYDVVRPEGDQLQNSPYAIKYLLGWSGIGPNKGLQDRLKGTNTKIKAITDTGTVLYEKVRKGDSEVKDLFDKMYQEEFVEKKGHSSSQEDQEFLKRMETGTKFEDGRYHMPLPFKQGFMPEVSDNRKEALRAAYGFRIQLNKNKGDEKSKVMKFMNRMEEEGYARKVPKNQLSAKPGHRYYLTYHSVKNPKKPEKTRVVFNCARKFGVGEEAKSFNDLLMTGPAADLCNGMIGVQMRWREEEVAFTADIQDMFYRNMVPDEQRSYMRYFWWDNEEMIGEPVEMQMNVHIFGASSSPACSNFALKRCAEDGKSEFSQETVDAVKSNFYVDDLCMSCPDIETGRKQAVEIRKLCAKGGYNLTKFLATDIRVLEDIPEECVSKKMEVGPGMQDERVERILGLKWILVSDEFQIEIVVNLRAVRTKREMLSNLSSIGYDPAGLISPFFLEGKMIMQSVSAAKIGWDDEIDECTQERYVKWLKSLSNLGTVRQRRCFKPKGFGKPTKSELHAYSDACEYGYGCGVYLRLENGEGLISVSLVAGKSRVIPMAGETIPRAELEAARLTAELVASIADELTYENLDIHCYTDSKVVLGYLKNKEKKFKTFVSHRVRDIDRAIGVSKFQFVSSEENVGDDASRGIDASSYDELSNHRWFTGPVELWKPKSEWKVTEVELPDLSEDKEVKTEKKSCSSKLFVTCKSDACMKLTVGLSKWWDMRRRIALLMKIVNQRDSEEKDYAIDVEDLCKAEDRIVKSVQMECFEKEVEVLEAGKTLSESNRLSKFAPFLDGKELMRVGGRLENWDTDFEVKHPVILPSESHVTEAVVRDCHERVAHSGRGITTNELRNSGYYILDMTSVVKRVIHNCVTCRKLRGTCGEQKMAQLPKERLQEAPAFSYCCVDIAGPFICKNGRKTEKRYLAVFSDLVFRGVHIEICYTLDKNSMINAVRRFVSRRGNCRYMKSDNGTNFTGCVNELRRAMLEVEPDLRRYLVGLGCDLEWQWNTPYRSHAGGVWERPIGTMRRILESLLLKHPHQLSDEELWTLSCEVENMMNCRPITVDSVADPTSPTPLSPMTLLTQKTKVVLPPFGKFDKRDSYGRSWRKIQHLANEFWDRFRKEYFAEIQSFAKWTQLRRNLRLGDVVLMKDESLHRNDWPLAIVDEVYKDNDGLVRKAKVRLGRKNWKETVKVYERPITKLVLLVENA